MWKLMRTTYLLLSALVLAACGGVEEISSGPPASDTDAPSLLNIPFDDVRTGETFTIADYAGQTVFIEPMATW